MFVCLAGYLDVLAFHQNSSMLITKQEFLSVKVRKKSKYPIIFKFVFITNVAHFSAKVSVSFFSI